MPGFFQGRGFLALSHPALLLPLPGLFLNSRAPAATMGDPKAQVLDTLFGTRYHTPGAALQLPRKVPMRVEPKSYFGETRAQPVFSSQHQHQVAWSSAAQCARSCWLCV